MEDGGNEKSAMKWLYRWNKEANPEPDSSDLEAVREFIRLKYVEKKWFRPYSVTEAPRPAKEAPNGGYSAAPTKAPVAPAAPEGAMDLLSGGSPQNSPAKMPNLLGGDLAPSAGTSVQAPASDWTADFSNHAPEVPSLGGIADGLIDLDFSATNAPATKASPPTPKDVDTTPAAKAPVAEPAEEPAPAQAEADSITQEDTASMGEKLRQAVMSGSQNDLMRLFEQCSKVATPPKKVQDPARFAAFAAFDELSGGGEAEAPAADAAEASEGTKKPVQAQSQPQPQQTAPQDLAGLDLGGPAKTAQGSAGPECFFIGDDAQPVPDPIAAAFAATDPIAAAFAATSSSSMPGRADARAPSSQTFSPEKLVELMPQGLASQLTPHQLQTMGAQDLMQLQMMISSALQARSQQQAQVAAPSPAPAAWQAASAARTSADSVDWSSTATEPAKDAQFGDLLDMFNKKN